MQFFHESWRIFVQEFHLACLAISWGYPPSISAVAPLVSRGVPSGFPLGMHLRIASGISPRTPPGISLEFLKYNYFFKIPTESAPGIPTGIPSGIFLGRLQIFFFKDSYINCRESPPEISRRIYRATSTEIFRRVPLQKNSKKPSTIFLKDSSWSYRVSFKDSPRYLSNDSFWNLGINSFSMFFNFFHK